MEENKARSGSRSAATLLLAGLLPGALLGGGSVWLALHHHDHEEVRADQTGAAPAAVAKKKPLYQCPMHPSITSDHPGNCPICGMKLVEVDQQLDQPKQETSRVKGMADVTIDPTRQQLIGLRTAKVSKGAIGNAWRTVARIQVAPSRVRKTNVKVEGFVERIFVDFVGQSVRKGQPLFSIYSPSLVAAQSEYLLALSSRDALVKAGALAENGETLVASARRRLELWDVPAAEIDRLTTTREPNKTMTLVSPIAGVVTAKSVVQGARVSPGEAPYEITDLGEVWVMADAYESDIGRIHPNMKASLTLAAYPNRTFAGMVAFIDPLLDPKTRTAKVHLHFANPTRELKPEMFGEVTLQGVSQEGLQIPADAVIRAGSQDVVFVALGQGRFEPRAIEVGARSGDLIEVKTGLADGTEVVTRANFLVDSESQLRASLAAIGGK
jgi:Cu(I)/Ag(I) efflux system membrane fusion protein